MQPLSLLVLVFLQTCTYSESLGPLSHSLNADSPQSEAFDVASVDNSSQGIEFNLSDYQWQHRIVVIFAPSEQSSAYQQQMQAWKANTEGTLDRDLKVVEVLAAGESRADGQPISPASAEQLRRQFGVTTEDVTVILVGKDGAEKQRKQAPVEPAMLFRTIDAMPMRQQEMRS